MSAWHLLAAISGLSTVATALTTWCTEKHVESPCPGQLDASSPLWCQVSAPVHERVAAFIANLTIADKAALLATPGRAPLGSRTGPLPRLHYPEVFWWHEGLHGLWWMGVGKSTSWPAVLGVASSLNRSLFKQLGELTGTEARAKCGVQSDLWAPVVNLLREPRWGRGQETPGEDPFLNSEFGVASVTGLQGDDPKYLRVASTVKHFVAYDSPENNPPRFGFNAKVSAQDLADSYFPAFQATVQRAKAAGIMCSYNAVNGVPMCANPMLNTVLRDRWGMKGYVVSDCEAFDDVWSNHSYTTSLNSTIAVAYGAGMDLYNCGQLRSSDLEAFMKDGPENEATLSMALSHLLEVQMRLGFFDPPAMNPYSRLDRNRDVDTPRARQLAKEAAAQSLVLLMNRDRLPLKPGRTLALIGPNANASAVMQGNYGSLPKDAPFLRTPVQGFARFASKVDFERGCDVNTMETSGIEAAVEAARKADDVVIVAGLSSISTQGFAGLDPAVEYEMHDRTSLLLPGQQGELIRRVVEVAARPVVLLLMSGSAIDVSVWQEHPNIGAIMWVGYPSQSGGDAMAEAIMGVVSPAGRLPMTWYYNNLTKQTSVTQMDMRPDLQKGYPGRTYRFFTGPVLYKFGHGLTYSKFAYEVRGPAHISLEVLQAQLRTTLAAPHLATPVVEVHVLVHNMGDTSSDVSVPIFIIPPNAGSAGAPLRQLRAFDRLSSVAARESRQVTFNLTAHDFALADADGIFSVKSGHWSLQVGGDEGASAQILVAPAEPQQIVL